MNLDISKSELHVSWIFAASSKHAGWVRLTPFLTLENHVSKRIQLHEAIA